MIYRTENLVEYNNALKKIEDLSKKKAVVEIRQVKRKRSIKQNSYLHVLINIFSIETGFKSAETKQIIKTLCPGWSYSKNGFTFFKETSKSTTEEIKDFIDWFRNWAAIEQGVYLPTSEEYLKNSISIDSEIKYNKEYL